MKTNRIILGLAVLCLLANCTKDSPIGLDEQEALLDYSQGISSHIPDEFKTHYDAADLLEMDELAKGNYGYGATLRSANEIIIEAGSSNALQDAVANANPDDKIIFKAGIHTQAGTAVVDKRVHIYGEQGAVLQCSGFPLGMVPPLVTTPAIQIESADHTIIESLHLTTTESSHPLAILILNSKKVRIVDNQLDNFQFGIIVQNGDKARIYYNTINANPTWITGEIPLAEGIVIINGDLISLVGNSVSSSVLGIFTGGVGGVSMGNKTFGNAYGQILCRVPQAFQFPNGDIVGAEASTKRWLVKHNNSTGNFNAGYLVIDGASQCMMVANKASQNGMYDIELAGISQRFGFETPACFDNRVYATRDMIIKDCGDDNRVLGGVLVDNGEDPCF